jgi:sugar-specific transcriptional regulator TrmB
MGLEFLRKIGLSPGEIKIYSMLLDDGTSPLSKIHEKTGIERRNIYDILNKLIEKGLVSYIFENKKRYFSISHPSNIIAYLEQKEGEIEKTKEDVQKELPAILEKFKFAKSESSSEIFRGAEGVKAVWEDTLNYKEMYWIGAGRYVPKKYPQWFSNWNRRRISLKVKWHNLLRDELKKEVKVAMQYEEVKFLPKEFSGNQAVIGVYGNKVANFLLGEELFVFVIENKELAENYIRYHKYLWDNVAKNK